MEKVLRAAAYARVSTDKDDQINSLESQKTYFTEYILARRGWTLTQIYYDEGISGTQTEKRAGFNAMIASAMRGEIDIILTKEVCRFARNTVDTLYFTRRLKEADVGVIFTIDNIDTRDADGELRLTIMACIAQEESRKTSERVKWGQKRRMEQGIVFGRNMLGYTVKNGVLTINDEEVPVVRAIFHKYTNEGKGAHIIARELMEEGLYPKYISCWSNTTILRVLRNEKYAGDLCQKKTITPNFLTHQKKKNHGEEEMIYLTDHHAPIIDRDLWNRTQAELLRRSPSGEAKVKYSNRYWCSGRILCGECGRNFVSHTKKTTNGTLYKAWRCLENASHGTRKNDACGGMGCDNHSVNELALLTCVCHAVRLIAVNREKIKKEMMAEINQIAAAPVLQEYSLAERAHSMERQTLSPEEAAASIEKLQAKKRKAIDLMLEGIITKEDLLVQTQWYDKEIEALNQEKIISKQKGKQKETLQADFKEIYSSAIDEILYSGETNGRLYHEILERIVIHRDNYVDVWLKYVPFGIRLKIKTSGRLTAFHTEILETLFLKRKNTVAGIEASH